jgi:endoglucanase
MMRRILFSGIFKIFLCVLCLAIGAPLARAANSYVRVSQVGYEAGQPSMRAYLMSTTPQSGATFQVLNSAGASVSSGTVGALLGTWAHSKKLTYYVYAIDFTAQAGGVYQISVSGPVTAASPTFAVDRPEVLYPGLLLNTLFFYQTERDGPDYIHNALRSAPGHLKDQNAAVYDTPALDVNDEVDNVPPAAPLVSANLPNMDASGGWWDAGDYMKYVETISYTTALMQIGLRDFPNQMGKYAPVAPAAPPNSVSYAGNSGAGAPRSSDFTGEAQFGIDWLLKMWNDQTRTLYYQMDNSQDFDYYGFGTPTSAAPNCGGTYPTPYCLITEYDIWTLPQAADNYQQPGDPEPCDPYTTVLICNRPAFVAGPAGSPISPNLAGRLAASFALCYQVNQGTNPLVANQCLKNAEDIFALADTNYPDPAPSVGSGSCSTCLLTIIPFDGYPETVWDDDMELGATELALALQTAAVAGNLPPGIPQQDPMVYLRAAAQYAHNYVVNVYDTGNSDTLNLYDVSGLAHFELYRAFERERNPTGLAMSSADVLQQFLKQVDDAISRGSQDAWGFGAAWNSDTTSHGAGLAVMASEAHYLTGSERYDTYSQRWLANVLGANAWGSSFIVGDGTTFPNCIQHQVANLAGSLTGTSGGTPILWGAATEGPATAATSGLVGGMIPCPANGVDKFAKFNGNDGALNAADRAVYQDNVQSYSTTEPAIDLTSTSFLMWSWRLAQTPAF